MTVTLFFLPISKQHCSFQYIILYPLTAMKYVFLNKANFPEINKQRIE